ncbi:SDR family oxidoreductase [Gracilibacillus phocaeensis]|uniref:SDR family oxidoreductase n=1 Tax=Gracilibacillus phocaeensis TaxID=2042304 RepID=UPI00102F6445|nr:SDR family oxidoreductase [Gracilibacillus phocaeensis]
MKHVLVAGATGYLGRYVVKELKKQGFYTKVLVRDPDKLDQIGNAFAPSIAEDVDEVVIGDITKPETVTNICDHIDYVFSTVGMTRERNGLTFHDVDYQGNLNLLKEAERSHAAKFIYVHVYRTDDWKEPGPLIEAKEKFVEVLTASSIDHMIIRPTGYFSDIASLLGMAQNGRVFLIGDGRARMNPIHGEDLAQYCIRSFAKSNQTLDVGGPETFSYQQMAQLAFDLLNKRKRATRIPTALFNLISKLLKWSGNHNYGLFRFFFNVMTHDLTAPSYGDHRIRAFFKEMMEEEHNEITR